MKKLGRNQWIAIGVAVVIFVWFFATQVVMPLFVFNQSANIAHQMNMMPSQNPIGSPITLAPGLVAQDIIIGTGEEAVAGKNIIAHYTGKLQNGTQFDTSIGREPFQFPLGVGLVIQGWDKGIVGMKEGGKRILTISPELGYGPTDMKDRAGNIIIPANSTLIFEVELLEVQ